MLFCENFEGENPAREKVYNGSMAIQRLVSPDADEEIISPEEQRQEMTLRPQNFADYIGQERLKRNLKMAIEAAKKRGEPIDHVLLYGPPGLGKTTMAGVIAHEMNAGFRATSAPAIERAGDLAAILTNLQDSDILFIDEIHRLNRAIEEILYAAMEDFKLDIVIGKGPAARSVRLDLPRFSVIGATTRTGSLAAPLRDRFGHIYRLEFYQNADIEKIIQRSANILETKIDDSAAKILAQRSRRTPRIANRLLKRVRDYADVKNFAQISESVAREALEILEIDELGLDPADRQMLAAILENYGERPVGLNTIAALTGDEATTIEDFYEPYLLQIGFLERTPRGRKITKKAADHIKKFRDKL